jgi:hypothetical protein
MDSKPCLLVDNLTLAVDDIPLPLTLIPLLLYQEAEMRLTAARLASSRFQSLRALLTCHFIFLSLTPSAIDESSRRGS